MAEAAFRSLHAELLRRAYTGDERRRGALAHLTPERVAAAAAGVRQGRTVSLAAPIETWAGPDDPQPAVHRLIAPIAPIAPETGAPGVHFALDRFAMNVHGDAHTHLDALCHVVFDGELHGGLPEGRLTAGGARGITLDLVRDGIVGPGVLLDVPRLRGVPWLEPGDSVTADDLTAAEEEQGVRVEPGDLLLVRVGHRRRRGERGAWDAAHARAGLHPAGMRLLAERRVAVLGSDGNNDTAPSPVTGVPFPVHVLALHALGMHLMDYLDLEGLARACAELGRWRFLCAVAPLRLPGATGSPVNPIAVL
ncbi:cyclase family protein [Streptomyces sp. NPDC046876]|uniref:cyclase family protein n=1 Tax=Streptomyces sp. NPDC046876 TaxID=3155616 RepID=UPI0033D13739